jgi:DNA-binding CsgD family transcriptional regulator
MYHVAVISNEATLFSKLDTCARRYFDKLIILHGPYENITAAEESRAFTGTITAERDAIRISPIQPLDDGAAHSVSLSDELPPLRVLVALLAVLESFDIRDREETGHPDAGILTAREIEVLQFVSGGYSNGEIAGYLKITERTVKYHVSEILRKLKVSSRTEAVVEAARSGIIAL